MQTTIPTRVLTGVVLPISTRGVVGIAITAGLIVGFALLTALTAQIAIPLPFTPVPISGQTFGVILAGAALGSTAGASSQIVYILMAGIGLPFWAGGESGWEVMSGATAGYIVGFVVAAWVIGRFAERTADRHVLTAVPAIVAGSLIIHVFGVLWLARVLDTGMWEAAKLGTFPFIPGDIAKAVLAGLLCPRHGVLSATCVSSEPSGVDDRRRRIEELFAADDFAAHVGIRLVSSDPAHVVVEMPLDGRHHNFHVVTHGAAVFSLADTAFALASNAAGDRAVAIDTHLALTARSSAGDTLTATAEEVTRGRTIGTYRITVRRSDRRICGLFTGTVHITPASG